MKGMTITVQDFQSICRLCLCNSGKMIPFNVYISIIFENVLKDVLSKSSSLRVIREDTSPKQLCQQCFEELSECNNFISMYQKSEETVAVVLKKQEGALKIKQEEVDISDEMDCPARSELLHCEECRKEKQFCLCNESQTSIKKKTLYKCNFCEKSFAKKRYRYVHENGHVGIFKCRFCQKNLGTKGNLVIHERTHTGEKPFKCAFCEKSYIQKKYWVVHQRIHTGDSPFKCAFCEKSFTAKSTQIGHERTHTGERPYKCGYCEKSFALKCTRIHHERTHTGEKPYKCSFCERFFSKKQRQIRHEKLHSVQKLCKGSVQKRQPTVHKNKRTGEKS